jgi:NAD(P)-dependent dehydrogenase (short-subunit alcohol dehydrogenase family)
MTAQRVVLIPGASGGLGRSVVAALLDDGATVVGVARSWKRREHNSDRFIPLEADLTRADAARTLVDETLSRTRRIDALIQVMGGFAGGTTVAETDDETLDHMLSVNLRSSFYVMRAVIPHLVSQKSGRIVAIGSRTGVEPAAGLGAYGLSKAALIALVKTVALEVAKSGITANVILPSIIDTEQNRASDPGGDYSGWVKPASIASLVTWLLSDAAREVNGAAIPIYGGA